MTRLVCLASRPSDTGRPWRLTLLAPFVLSIAPLLFGHVPAQEPGHQAGLFMSKRDELAADRDRLWQKLKALLSEDKLPQAVEAAEQVLSIERKLYGQTHAEVVATLEMLAHMNAERGAFSEAAKWRRETLAAKTRLYGERDWRVADERIELQRVQFLRTASAAQRRALVEAEKMAEEATELHRAGDFTAALRLAERSSEMHRKLLGEKHHDYAMALNITALIHASMGNYSQAETLYLRVLAIADEVVGKKHPLYAAGQNNLAEVYSRTGDYGKAKPLFLHALEVYRDALGDEHPALATFLSNLALVYKLQGEYGKAKPLYRQALELRKNAFGEKHPDYATTLNNLASLHTSLGDYTQAEQLFRETLAIKKEVLGEKHPDYALSLNGFACLLQLMGDYAKAESLQRQALEIDRKVLGENHPNYAGGLNNLAGLYVLMGEHARAETLYLKSQEVLSEVLGKEHPKYAMGLDHLATLYATVFDLAEAESLYRQALELKGQVLGHRHPEYAKSLQNLAHLYDRLGDYVKAEPLYCQALEINREALGHEHPEYVTILVNLAGVYMKQGNDVKAELLYRQGLEIRKETLGERHPDYAHSLNNLGILLFKLGNYVDAEPLYRQALEIQKETLGAQHLGCARSLSNSAVLFEAIGECAKAQSMHSQALAITELNLELYAAVQSEKQQLEMSRRLRCHLDPYLAFSSRTEQPNDAVYRYVLMWKGATLARQRWLRLSQDVTDPETARKLNQLQSTARRLATLTFSVPDPAKRDSWRRQIEELSTQRERLERDLAQRHRELHEELSRPKVTVAEVRKALPADAALVDFLEYVHIQPPTTDNGQWKWDRRLVAFVVRSDGPIVRVELGPLAPIAQAVDRWRDDLAGKRIEEGSEPSRELRRLIWQPLAEHLKDAKTILVSPDGELNRLPLAALPGRKTGSYLIEDTALAIVPVPQMLPELLAPRPGKPSDDVPPSMLLVGDPDFDASPGVEPDTTIAAASPWRRRRAGALQSWNRLPGTRAEILAIEDSYTKAIPGMQPHVLRDREATESAVRRRMPHYEYLHLATHGFFAPPNVRSALAFNEDQSEAVLRSPDRQGVVGYHPDLLSGIALAGANKPAVGGDDGVLTAMEVAAMDLRKTELVVLSACETGLGEVAGGEGVLGLQRAFQLAGARSVVASLWKVDDQATRKLMERFYENYWTRQMGMLDSLREAQLWMMQEATPRGAVRLDQVNSDDEPNRLPPFYWAGFVLSGDWR